MNGTGADVYADEVISVLAVRFIHTTVSARRPAIVVAV